MKHFTMQNIDGFDQGTLNKMNDRMTELGADNLDQYDFREGQDYKVLSEKVFKEFGF